MKKIPSKAMSICIAVVLLLLVVAGPTLAYLLDQAGPVANIFQPAQVTCAVMENGQEYTSNAVSVSSKSNVSIKNTGNVPAYIRAVVLVTWKSADGIVYGTVPTAGTDKDYTIQFNTEDWTKQGSFYYYNDDVPAGDLTEILIVSANQLHPGPVGSDGTQYYLSVEIVAEAIQAGGMGADSAPEAWATVGP